MDFVRNEIDENGESKEEERFVTIKVKPGTESGTEYFFPREGNRSPGNVRGDAVFVLVEKPNTVFKRKDNANLEYTANIYADKVFTGQLDIPLLEGGSYPLKFDNVTKDTRLEIPGKGLPFSFKPSQRGDIHVKFSIVPKQYKGIC